MYSTDVYYLLYTNLVNSIESLEEIVDNIIDPLKLPFMDTNCSVPEAAAIIVDECRYRGQIPQLFKLLNDLSRVEPNEQRLINRATDVRHLLAGVAVTNRDVAVAVTMDLVNRFSLTSRKLGLRFLCDVEKDNGVLKYCQGIARNLDRCGTFIGICGRTQEAVGRPDSGAPCIPSFEFEYYFAVSRNLPTYLLVPKEQIEEITVRYPGATFIQDYSNEGTLQKRFEELQKNLSFGKLSDSIIQPKDKCFDIVFSFNMEDEPLINQVIDKLKRHGYIPWIAQKESLKENDSDCNVSQWIEKVKVTVFFFGKAGIGESQRHQIDALDGLLRDKKSRNIRIIYVVLSDVGNRPEIPQFLQSAERIDLSKEENSVAVDRLVELVKDEMLSPPQPKIPKEKPHHQPIKVFISYSHVEQEYFSIFKEDFIRFAISTSFKIDVISDDGIPLGAAWDKFLQTKVANCDAMILLVSQGFMTSKYIQEKEFGVALERFIAEHKLLIIPIYFAPCTLDDEKLNQLQFFKPDGRQFDAAEIDDFSYADFFKNGDNGLICIKPSQRARYMKELMKKLKPEFIKLVGAAEK